MQTLAQIKDLLASRGLSPKKSLGQNFLIDHNLIRKLADAASLSPGSLVLEVGPGTGALTDELLARGCTVIACELDDNLASLLAERHPLGGPALRAGSLTVIHGDCLHSKRELSRDVARALAGRPFKLVANLPYGAATPLMLALLTRHPECAELWVTVQKEVADRFLAQPDTPDYGSVSIVGAATCHGRRLARLGPECFWPRPTIDSTMFGLIRRSDPLTKDPAALADFCQQLFNKRRKQLGSVLKGPLAPAAWPAGIRPDQRAENLSPAQVISLFDSIPLPPTRIP